MSTFHFKSINRYAIKALLFLFIFIQCTLYTSCYNRADKPDDNCVEVDSILNYHDSFIDLAEEDIDEHLSSCLIKRFEKWHRHKVKIQLSSDYENNGLIGIREFLDFYSFEGDSCTIIEMYCRKKKMEMYLWAKQVSPDSLRAIRLTCYPSSWDVEF